MKVPVPAPMRDWVQSRVESGRYATATDYLLDLIRRDQEESSQREALISALMKGERSGTSLRQVPEIFAALKAELGTDRD